MRAGLLLAILVPIGCGGEVLEPGARPVTWPCPADWVDVRVDGARACAPYEDGPEQCGPGRAHFVGAPGCRALETSCEEPPPGPTFVLEPGFYEGTLEIPNGVTVQGGCGPLSVIVGTVRVTGTATLAGVSVQPPSGPGVVVEGADAVLTMEEVEVAGAEGAGVIVEDARLVARSLIVRDTRRTPGAAGFGIRAFGGARLEIERAAFVRNPGPAVVVGGAGSAARLQGALVEDGPGITIGRGAAAHLRRIAAYDAHEVGLTVDTDATVTLEDAVIARPRSRPTSQTLGFAVAAAHGARLRVTRGWFTESHDLAVLAADRDTRVRLEDVVVSDTDGRGVLVTRGADLALARVALLGARSHALRAVGEETRLVGRDVAITRAETGLVVDDGATADLSSVDVRASTALEAKAVETPAHVVVHDARLQGDARAVFLEGRVTFEAYRSWLLGPERVEVSGSGTRVQVETGLP